MPDKSQLRYPIDKLKANQKVLQECPELSLYPVFVEYGSDANDCWLRFAALFADKGSEYRDLPVALKKQECMKRAGVPPSDPRRKDVEQWRDKGVVAMVNQYVRLLNDLDYAAWFHSLIGIYDSLEQVSKHIDAKDLEADKEGRAFLLRHQLISQINTQRKDIRDLGNELFLSDEELRQAAQEEVMRDTGSVEKRAQGQSFVPSRN